MELESLLERLWEGDEEARDRLRQMGADAAPAVPALGDALRPGNKRRCVDALFVLEGIGSAARPAVPALVSTLADSDGDVSALAADALGSIGEPAVPAIVEALESGSKQVRQAACQALGVAGADAGQAVPALLERADHDHAEVRTRAIWALGEIRDYGAAGPLAAILERDGGVIGCWIAETLGKFGRHARDVSATLRDELHREDPFLAVACAASLCQMHMFEDSAIWALISMLSHEDEDARVEAALTLGDLGPKAAAGVPALNAAARDGDEDLRAAAAMAIAKIRPEAAAPLRTGTDSRRAAESQR